MPVYEIDPILKKHYSTFKCFYLEQIQMNINNPINQPCISVSQQDAAVLKYADLLDVCPINTIAFPLENNGVFFILIYQQDKIHTLSHEEFEHLIISNVRILEDFFNIDLKSIGHQELPFKTIFYTDTEEIIFILLEASFKKVKFEYCLIFSKDYFKKVMNCIPKMVS